MSSLEMNWQVTIPISLKGDETQIWRAHDLLESEAGPNLSIQKGRLRNGGGHGPEARLPEFKSQLSL